MTRWYVDGWNPAYGTSFEAAEDAWSPSTDSSAQVDPDVELPAASWRACPPPPGLPPPDVVLLVDGVRRIDATLWTDAAADGVSHPGLAASYAAGVVRCDLRRGVAELVDWQVERGLFTSDPTAADVACGPVRYRARQVEVTDPTRLPQAVQPALTELEMTVSARARRGSPGGGTGPDGCGAGAGPDGAGAGAGEVELLVVDGPLRQRRRLEHAVGYVKTQQGRYLPAALTPVVTGLRPGERCPVFRVGTAWGGYSWYLRLPGRAGAPWAGIVRVECSPDLAPKQAIELAELSTVTLPRFAATAYKDPRAPQNLIPIAGLERRLRALLGNPRLLHRALTVATARP